MEAFSFFSEQRQTFFFPFFFVFIDLDPFFLSLVFLSLSPKHTTTIHAFSFSLCDSKTKTLNDDDDALRFKKSSKKLKKNPSLTHSLGPSSPRNPPPKSASARLDRRLLPRRKHARPFRRRLLRRRPVPDGVRVRALPRGVRFRRRPRRRRLGRRRHLRPLTPEFILTGQ